MATAAERTLGPQQARRVYNALGPLQDLGAFIEDRANRRLLAPARFAEAKQVLELGCGTGRVAERLLVGTLDREARYDAIDISDRMRRLAARRLRRFGERVRVLEAAEPADWPAGPYDVVFSTFVIDLLAAKTIRAWFAAAAERLPPGGRLALTSLLASKPDERSVASRMWHWAFSLSPYLVGGCRPVDMHAFAAGGPWRTLHDERLVACGLPLGILVLERT